MATIKEFTAAQAATWCGGTLEGDATQVHSGIDFLDLAGPTQLTFASKDIYALHVAESAAAGVLCQRGLKLAKRPDQLVIWVENADLAVVAILEQIAPALPLPALGVHTSAVIESDVQLGADVRIGAHVVVQAGAVLGDRVVLMPGCFIGAESHIGADTVLWPHVTVRERCTVGQRCILHPGVVIGADGFGYRFHKGRHVKVPHVGTVEIGDDCELGANTCVDRGKFAKTVIGSGSKMDNMVQVGHNVRLGQHAILVSHACIGGSTQVGDYLLMGGGAVLTDHIKVGKGVQVAGMAGVTEDFADGQRICGIPARPMRAYLHSYKYYLQLPETVKLVRDLTQQLADMQTRLAQLENRQP